MQAPRRAERIRQVVKLLGTLLVEARREDILRFELVVQRTELLEIPFKQQLVLLDLDALRVASLKLIFGNLFVGGHESRGEWHTTFPCDLPRSRMPP